MIIEKVSSITCKDERWRSSSAGRPEAARLVKVNTGSQRWSCGPARADTRDTAPGSAPNNRRQSDLWAPRIHPLLPRRHSSRSNFRLRLHYKQHLSRNTADLRGTSLCTQTRASSLQKVRAAEEERDENRTDGIHGRLIMEDYKRKVEKILVHKKINTTKFCEQDR